jgi:hypothetical protein
LLETSAQRNAGLAVVVEALVALVRHDAPDPEAVRRLEALLDDPERA